MKNFKIVMILVAAVAMFCSCGDPEAPAVALTDATSLSETTFNLADPSLQVTLGLATSDEKGFKSITITRTSLDAEGKVLGKPVDFPVPAADYEGVTDFSFAVVETLVKDSVKDAAKVVYEAVVTNKKDVQGSATYTVNIVAPAFTEGTFEWKREGTTVTGNVAEYGLEWGGTTTDLKATFKPVDGGKLYVLSAADYANTDAQAVANLLASKTPVTAYYGISASTAHQNLTDVLATVHGDQTHLIKLETAEVVSRATNITVTGSYKVFATVAASSAK